VKSVQFISSVVVVGFKKAQRVRNGSWTSKSTELIDKVDEKHI